MAYVETWDETKPAGTRDANLGDDDIREFKRAVRERLAGGGMYFPSTDDADAGKFNWVNFKEQSSNPTAASNEGFLFCKDVSGATELHYMDASGNVTQLTSGSKLLISSLIIASEARGDIIYRAASAWARLAAGTSGQYLKTQGAGADPIWADVNFQTAASQAEMEAAASDSVPVTPLKTKFHPAVAKAWGRFDGTGANGAKTAVKSHNIASINKDTDGTYTITFTSALSDANYIVVASGVNGTDIRSAALKTAGASSFVLITGSPGTGLENCSEIHFAVFGDL